MKISEIMNRNVTTIKKGSTMREAAGIASRSQASDLMVLDDEDCFIGVVSEGDLVREALPNPEELMIDSESMLPAFDLFIDRGASSADKLIDSIVINSPLTFSSEDEVLKAAATMIARKIRRLPVVDDDRLVGTISRSDIAHAVMS